MTVRDQWVPMPGLGEAPPRGWVCPLCAKVLSPTVEEHRCSGSQTPQFGELTYEERRMWTHGTCDACRGGVCGCYRPEYGPTS